MKVKETVERAKQILDEERLYPTVGYGSAREETNTAAALLALSSAMRLPLLRRDSPRDVLKDPTEFKFQSANHDLLRVILSQFSGQERDAFCRYVGARLVFDVGCTRKQSGRFPEWDGLISELPLVVEFLVRNGAKSMLFDKFTNSDTKITPGHVLMLLELEDMVALNYSVFNESEYLQLISSLAQFRANADARLSECLSRQLPAAVRYSDIGSVGMVRLYSAIAEGCQRIAELCRKARYLYLQSFLLEGQNLEVNQDKVVVESYLKKFGFPQLLIDSLNAAETLYRQQGSPFDHKSCIGHLRSFLENAHGEAVKALSANTGDQPNSTWGAGMEYLVQKNVLTRKEQLFVGALYTLISDEGVHPLVAEREYARVARNMVIEYALLFFTKLEKLSVSSRSS